MTSLNEVMGLRRQIDVLNRKLAQARRSETDSMQVLQLGLVVLIRRLGGSATLQPAEVVQALAWDFDLQEGADGSLTVRAVPKAGAA